MLLCLKVVKIVSDLKINLFLKVVAFDCIMSKSCNNCVRSKNSMVIENCDNSVRSKNSVMSESCDKSENSVKD